MYVGKSLALAFLALALSGVVLAQTGREQAIIDRISPVASICMVGDPCASGSGAASSGPRAAADIYNTYCMACHLTGAQDAPLFGNAEQWAPRIEQGMDVLVRSVVDGIVRDGFEVMPPMGLCNNCSDEEIRATVEYMVDAAR